METPTWLGRFQHSFSAACWEFIFQQCSCQFSTRQGVAVLHSQKSLAPGIYWEFPGSPKIVHLLLLQVMIPWFPQSSIATTWVVSVVSSSGFASDPSFVTITGTRQSFEEYHEGSTFGADIEVSCFIIDHWLLQGICTAWVALQMFQRSGMSTSCWDFFLIIQTRGWSIWCWLCEHLARFAQPLQASPKWNPFHFFWAFFAMPSQLQVIRRTVGLDSWKSDVPWSKVGVCRF